MLETYSEGDIVEDEYSLPSSSFQKGTRRRTKRSNDSPATTRSVNLKDESEQRKEAQEDTSQSGISFKLDNQSNEPKLLLRKQQQRQNLLEALDFSPESLPILKRNKTHHAIHHDEFTTIASKIQHERKLWSSRERRRNSIEMKRQLSAAYLLEIQRIELERFSSKYDRLDEALDILEQEVDTLEQNIANALDVLNEQVQTVLVAKRNQCEYACERIKDLYEDIAASREEIISRIPDMIKANIDVVMDRVLKAAVDKSGGIHSDLDVLFAKTQRSGSIYKLVVDFLVNLEKKFISQKPSRTATKGESIAALVLQSVRVYHVIGILVLVLSVSLFVLLVSILETQD